MSARHRGSHFEGLVGKRGRRFPAEHRPALLLVREQDVPSDRFDDISATPRQVKVKAMSPLCHASVSKWILAAGAEVTSKAKKERWGKAAGEVVHIVTTALNEYFDGKWTPPAWKPSKAIEHCVQ